MGYVCRKYIKKLHDKLKLLVSYISTEHGTQLDFEHVINLRKCQAISKSQVMERYLMIVVSIPRRYFMAHFRSTSKGRLFVQALGNIITQYRELQRVPTKDKASNFTYNHTFSFCSIRSTVYAKRYFYPLGGQRPRITMITITGL